MMFHRTCRWWRRVASSSVSVSMWLGSIVAGLAADAVKPVFVYNRGFNAAGEARYLPDGTYREILRQLERDFSVKADPAVPTEASLAGASVVLIANPSDRAVGTNPAPRHVTAEDAARLLRFVERGGGLIIQGNQEAHNLETTDLNRFLARFGLQFTNRYTDAKKLVIPETAPVIGGLRWAYYTGNQILVTPGHPAHPRALVVNDLAQKPPKGTRDEPGVLLAAAEWGRGRVVVVTDAGWISDSALQDRGIGDVILTGHDNGEIFRRLVWWAAGREPIPAPRP